MAETIKEIKKLYGGEIEITFYPVSHQYRKEGKILTSVTGATGIIDKSTPLLIWAARLCKDFLLEVEKTRMIIPADIEEAVKQYEVKKEEAATKGKNVHEWIHKYIKGEKPDMPTDEQEINGVMAFLKWIDEHKVKFIETERLVYSRKYDYVGILDSIAEVDGKLTLIDFKTAKGFYSDQRYQTSGYTKAYEEETGKKIQQRIIARFDKESGEFDIQILNEDEKDWLTFLSCLEVKNREKEMASWQREANNK